MFDPSLPADNSPLDAGEMRQQLIALNLLVPVGAVLAWAKNLAGVPALPATFAECNGQVLADAESPLDGETLPDLNGVPGRFLRGDTTSGNLGGIDAFATVDVDFTGGGTSHSCVTPESSPGTVPFPPYYTVVWVIRVK